jgi:hypothetical protein
MSKDTSKKTKKKLARHSPYSKSSISTYNVFGAGSIAHHTGGTLNIISDGKKTMISSATKKNNDSSSSSSSDSDDNDENYGISVFNFGNDITKLKPQYCYMNGMIVNSNMKAVEPDLYIVVGELPLKFTHDNIKYHIYVTGTLLHGDTKKKGQFGSLNSTNIENGSVMMGDLAIKGSEDGTIIEVYGTKKIIEKIQTTLKERPKPKVVVRKAHPPKKTTTIFYNKF